MMISPRGTVLLFAVFVLSACTTSETSRRDANRDQVEAFLALQAKQNRIEEYARSLPQVLAATAYLRPDSVILKMFLKPGTIIEKSQQEKLNAFITKVTDIPRERISLFVPESNVPAMRRNE
jgi:hypothetical protein